MMRNLLDRWDELRAAWADAADDDEPAWLWPSLAVLAMFAITIVRF